MIEFLLLFLRSLFAGFQSHAGLVLEKMEFSLSTPPADRVCVSIRG